MFTVLGIMIAGIIAGYALRSYKPIFRFIGTLNMWIICLLLFVMGLSVGHNPSVMNNLKGLGITGILIGAAATAGSVLLAIPLYRYMFRNKKNRDEK